jgi:hypothetical protein
MVEEESVCRNAFELIFAFDEARAHALLRVACASILQHADRISRARAVRARFF